jgi:hypothetical protein
MRARVEVKTGVTGHEGWVADLGTGFLLRQDLWLSLPVQG